MSRLRNLRKTKGLSQAKLAEQIGVSQSDIARLEAGTRRMTADRIRRIAAALEIPPSELLEKDSSVPGQHEQGIYMVSPNSRTTEIPVYGFAVAGEDACISLTRPGIGVVPSHPRQQETPGAFAAYVACTSMMPRYRPGELVYAVPNEQPATGEDCIIELKEGQGFLKEFRTRTDKEIVCWQHHPPSEWRRPLADVAGVHLVVGRG